MNELLQELAGWQGLLRRGPVVAQVLAVVVVPLLVRMVPGLSRPWKRGISLLLLGAWTAMLALIGQPWALLGILTGLIAGWAALERVPRLLEPVLTGRPLEILNTRLLRPFYLLLALLLLLRLVDNPEVLGLIPIGDWMGSQLNLGSLLRALLLLYVLVMAMEPPMEVLAWLAQRFLGISDGSRRAMAVILHYAVVGLGLLWTLDRLGVNRTALVAIAGGLSVGVGFGIKEVVSNFISGLWLLIEGSVRPGDVLIVDGEACQVRRLGPRAATLWRDRDNAELLIPNQTFFTNATTTYTHTDSLRRCQVPVGAAYDHPPAEVIAVLEHATAAVAGVLKDPPPVALLLSYGDSAIQYGVRFWIASALDNTSICSAVQQAIWQAFREHAIEIPYPIQVQVERIMEPPGAGPSPPAVPLAREKMVAEESESRGDG